MTQEIVKKISVHDFYFETPLYVSINLADIEGNIYSGSVDGYSPIDNRDTTYSINPKEFGDYMTYYDSMTGVRLRDKRIDGGDLFFIISISEDEKQVVKIGQVPSLVDMQFANVTQSYSDVLDKENLFMLKRAIGLAAHGTGIGSFVYLRRIFENLIEETYINNKNESGISREVFDKKRIREKVETLSSYLPKSIAKLTPLYSILSKGIHELTEKECLAYFDTMKLAIELILKQKIKQKQEQDEEAETVRRLHEASQLLSTKATKND